MRGRSTSFDCIFRLIPKTLLAQVSKAGHLSKGLLVAQEPGLTGWPPALELERGNYLKVGTIA